MEYITRGRCGQEGCRERRYYLDNGLWFCRRGHQQEGRQIEEDPDDFGTQGKRSRVKKTAAEKGRRTYHGRQAYSLFLQTYQLILWKQSFALVQNRGFPAQFEHVVRDLWALRLETYASKIRDPDDDDNDELELFSSVPASDTEDNLDKQESVTSGGKHVQWPRLIDTIASCYLGALLMRLPVSVGDFHQMVIHGDVPYIRVIRTIPREMRDKLPQELRSIIETTLISLIVIGTKLLFPFDDVERYPVSAKEPTTQVIDWKIWGQAQRQYDNRKTSSGGIGKGNEIMVNDQDVFNMTPGQLDEYMDWYEKNWLDSSKGPHPLADMFPTGSSTGEAQQDAQPNQPSTTAMEEDETAIENMLQTVNHELKPRKIIPETDADVPRPGSAYTRYRMDSDLTESARFFYEIAAKISGISLATLVRAVSQAESRVMRWLEDQRRVDNYEEPFEMESAQDDSDDDLDAMSDGDMSDLDDGA
ncbi:Pol I core factor CF [Aspergillus nanangensis]|uniref:Pol I core factor CF n=1 Tax=Aspergillus nanangensis TaxID=2582783 RepID=A0AAD4CFY6_ASPNN|nr:Pol I core factor CF [Aspergillus nanangensis]